MKKSIKFLFLGGLALIMLNSCSKEMEDKTPQYGEKNVIVGISYGGDYENYEEVIGLQIIGNNITNTNVEGIKWTETTRPDQSAAQFQHIGNASGGVLKLKTTKPISGCTLVASFVPKDGVEIEEPMTINVQYFIENKLVKTDDFSMGEGDDTYQGILVINDYID